jgi:hypothetical protein
MMVDDRPITSRHLPDRRRRNFKCLPLSQCDSTVGTAAAESSTSLPSESDPNPSSSDRHVPRTSRPKRRRPPSPSTAAAAQLQVPILIRVAKPVNANDVHCGTEANLALCAAAAPCCCPLIRSLPSMAATLISDPRISDEDVIQRFEHEIAAEIWGKGQWLCRWKSTWDATRSRMRSHREGRQQQPASISVHSQSEGSTEPRSISPLPYPSPCPVCSGCCVCTCDSEREDSADVCLARHIRQQLLLDVVDADSLEQETEQQIRIKMKTSASISLR